MKNEKYTLEGYLFEDEESLKEAKTELEGVEYLKKRTNYSKPKNVLNIYNTVIEKKLFKTPIGYEFLKELQGYLYNNDKIDNEQIEAIPVHAPKSRHRKIKFNLPKIKKSIDKTSPYRTKYINMIVLNIIFLIFLILFIVISNNSKNLNIINYRTRINAEYTEKEDNLARWDEELKEREKQLENLENGEQ